MADGVRSTAGWIYREVSQSLDSILAWEQGQDSSNLDRPSNGVSKDYDSSSFSFVGKTLRIRRGQSHFLAYGQIVNFLSVETPISLILSDSQHRVRAVLSSQAVKKFTSESRGRSIIENTAGAVLVVNDFDLVLDLQSQEYQLYMEIIDFAYHGICSQFGRHTAVLSDAHIRNTLDKMRLIQAWQNINDGVHRSVESGLLEPSDILVQRVIDESSKPQQQSSCSMISTQGHPLTRCGKHDTEHGRSIVATPKTKGEGLLGLIRKNNTTAKVSAHQPIVPENSTHLNRDAAHTARPHPTAGVPASDPAPPSKSDATLKHDQTLPPAQQNLSDIEPTGCYIFGGDFEFTKFIKSIPHDDLYHEQARLLNMAEAHFVTQPGIKFAMANVPVAEKDYIRSAAQNRATHQAKIQAERMEHELRLRKTAPSGPGAKPSVRQEGSVELDENKDRSDLREEAILQKDEDGDKESLEEEDEGEDDEDTEAEDRHFSWSPSPNQHAAQHSDLPLDSSRPTSSRHSAQSSGQLQEVGLDGVDDSSDLEMQDPVGLDSPGPEYASPQSLPTANIEPNVLLYADSPSAIVDKPLRDTSGEEIMQKLSPKRSGPFESDSSNAWGDERNGSTPKRLKLTAVPPTQIAPSSLSHFEPPNVWYAPFTAAYPHYTADEFHFSKLLREATRHLDRLLIHWAKRGIVAIDDFVVRHFTEYIPYQALCVSEGVTPDAWIDFYCDNFNFAVHRKGIVTEPLLRQFMSHDGQSSPQGVSLVPATPGEALSQAPLTTPKDKLANSQTSHVPVTGQVAATQHPPLSVLQGSPLRSDRTRAVESTAFQMADLATEFSDKGEEDESWYSKDTVFKQFARDYGSLKSLKGSLGRVVDQGDSLRTIFKRDSDAIDPFAWDLGE